MPLQNLSQVGNTWVDAAQGMTSPLQEIEKKRAKRKEESLMERELAINEKKASAAATNASTLAATEARKATGEASLTARMKSLNQLYAPTAPNGTPEYMQQKAAYAAKLSEDSDLTIAEYGKDLIGQLEAQQKQTQLGGTTQAALKGQADIERTQAEARERGANADLAEAGRTQNMREASTQDQTWAANVLTQIDPGKQGGIWASMTTPNLRDEEMGALAQELAATLDQMRTQYPTMQETQLRALTIQQFKQARGWAEPAPPQPQASPMQQGQVNRQPPQPQQQAPQGLNQQSAKRQVILSR